MENRTTCAELRIAKPDLRVTRTGDGVIYLGSYNPLPTPSRAVGDWLVRWAVEQPDRVFLAERLSSGEWQKLTYGDALKSVRSVAAGLLREGASPQRPVAILSGNSINHALLALAAMHVGVPVAPI